MQSESQTPEKFDLRLHPTEAAHESIFVAPASLRIYESSVPELVSVVLYDRTDFRGILAGTRLTRGQALLLVEKLAEFLDMPSQDELLADGYAQGWEAARDADLGAA